MNTSTNGYYARVALSFTRKADADLIVFVRNVITMLTGNTQYPTPMPTLATVTTAVNDFEAKVHDALDGGKIPIATRNASRVQIMALMRQLAVYVQANCAADLLLLISSGFQAVRAPSPAGTLAAPQNPRLSLPSKTGELEFKFDRVKNAQNYSIQTASAASGPWEDEDISSASRVTIGGLTPGEVIWARAAANGAAGQSEWTTAISAMAI